MVASGQVGLHLAGAAVDGGKHEVVIALLEHHRAGIAMQAVVVLHLVALVEAPIVEGTHDVEVFMRQRSLALIEEVDAAIVGLSGVVEVFIFDIDVLLTMDVLIGGVSLPRPRFASRNVDFERLIGLADMGQVFRLEIEVARVEASVLVGGLKHRLRVMFKRNVIGIDVVGCRPSAALSQRPF